MVITVVNADSESTITTKNAEGDIASVEDAKSNTTNYVYDAFDNVTKVTDPVTNVTNYTYDIRGHRLTASDPDLGSWSYTYDALGELLTQTDAKSQLTSLTYDVKKRLTQRVEPSLTSTWTYDTAAHGINQLASATTNAGYTRALTYDTLSRPIMTTLTIASTNYPYTIAYNTTNGEIGSLIYPSGLQVNYGYNATGYLATLTDNATSVVYWTANTRDAELHLTQSTAGNGVITSQSFDPNTGLPLNFCATPHSGTCDGNILNYTYTWDLLGNLLTRADTVEGFTEVFCYDPLNRLTNSALGSGVTLCTQSGSGITTKTIGYDALGDVTSKSDVGTYTYPTAGSARPHAVSSITGTVNGVVNPTYSYDSNGNLTAGAGRSVTYTAFNMASQVVDGSTTVNLTYDSEHARITQAIGSATTTYLNNAIAGAMSENYVSGGATTWHDYVQPDDPDVPGAEEIAVERFLTGSTVTLQYFNQDNLGSASILTAANASVTERDSYDAWGRRRNPNGTDNTACSITSATTRGFTGQEMMDSICEINLNARIYDPTIARFVAADPVTSTPYNLQSLNRYSYVENGPLSAVDPTGEAFTDPFGVDQSQFSSTTSYPGPAYDSGNSTASSSVGYSTDGSGSQTASSETAGQTTTSPNTSSSATANGDTQVADQSQKNTPPSVSQGLPPGEDLPPAPPSHTPKEDDGNDKSHRWHPHWDEYRRSPSGDWGEWHTKEGYSWSSDKGKTWHTQLPDPNKIVDFGGPPNANDNPQGIIFQTPYVSSLDFSSVK